MIKGSEGVEIVIKFISNGLYLMVVLTESISCLENMKEIADKFGIDIPVIRVLKRLLKRKVEKYGAKK